MTANAPLSSFTTVDLSLRSAGDRAALLADYTRAVYAPAFSDEDLRESPDYWLACSTPIPIRCSHAPRSY